MLASVTPEYPIGSVCWCPALAAPFAADDPFPFEIYFEIYPVVRTLENLVRFHKQFQQTICFPIEINYESTVLPMPL